MTETRDPEAEITAGVHGHAVGTGDDQDPVHTTEEEKTADGENGATRDTDGTEVDEGHAVQEIAEVGVAAIATDAAGVHATGDEAELLRKEAAEVHRRLARAAGVLRIVTGNRRNPHRPKVELQHQKRKSQ